MWRLWLSTMYNTMLSRPPLVHLANFQRGLTTRKSRRPSPNVTMFPTCMTPAWPYVGVARATSQSPLRSSVLALSHLANLPHGRHYFNDPTPHGDVQQNPTTNSIKISMQVSDFCSGFLFMRAETVPRGAPSLCDCNCVCNDVPRGQTEREGPSNAWSPRSTTLNFPFNVQHDSGVPGDSSYHRAGQRI